MLRVTCLKCLWCKG